MSYFAQGHRQSSPLRHSKRALALESSQRRVTLSPSSAVWFSSSLVKTTGAAEERKAKRSDYFIWFKNDSEKVLLGERRWSSGRMKVGWEDAHGLHPTLHYQRSWAHCATWAAGVASCIFSCQVRDLHFINDSSFYHEILFSMCEDQRWPFSPLNEESRLWKFTLKSDSGSLLSFLIAKVSSDNDGKS